MDTIGQNLANWRASLMRSIPIAGLLSRDPIVYKWKAPFRCWLLREAAFWRITDLLTQSHALHQQNCGLGARILLRSGFETLSTLIYLNHKIRQTLDGKLNFHQFSLDTATLSLGSRDKSTPHSAVNVLSMIDRGNKLYPGLRAIYDGLSESAHPNFEGMVWGYSKVDRAEYETNFSNRWMEIYGERHMEEMDICMSAFHHEYDEVWAALMKDLEIWIAKNDAALEATKGVPPIAGQ